MVDLLEDVKQDTVTIDTENGDHDKFQHYCSKKAISDNLFYGTPMQALCGKIIRQQVDPLGRTVCPTCVEEYEKLEAD
jgi:hypothetical protein